MAEPDLQTLQRWLSLLTQHPEDATAGARSKAARALIPTASALGGKVIQPSATMAPMERVDVYNGGYLARLKGALESDYPGVLYALGDHGFFHLAHDYVRAHPSDDPNLVVFGRHLADFFARRKDYKPRAFLRDLARLEWAMVEAFHSERTEPLAGEDLSGIHGEDWPRVVLSVSPSLRLLETTYPVNGFLQAVFDEKEPEVPARQRSWLAVYRKDFRVWRLRLEKEAFAVLSALARGETFGTALAFAAERAEHVGSWFQTWAADGLFTGYRIDEA